ncbi:MAG TPA: wax ester/triacylglycerol synthase family O-acyltransferase [Thermoleophilaceae bacterium]|nr:wax ester/triacylglycerol synthase family O-acyltransferase [Thermoleophilaceae bacterium]
MRQLTPLDAQFLAVESSRTYGHVGGLAIYDPSTAPGGTLGIPEICRLVSERLHMLPPFRWRLVQVPLGLDLPYWVEDEDFDLDFHIRESAVPPPGGDEQLANTVARIFARPLDRSRPLWELYLIHGLAGGRVALLTKVHHAVVDGVSGNEILTVLLDPSPEGRQIERPSEEPAAGRKPGDLEMLGRGVAGLARQPLRALRSVPTALPNLTELPGANAFPGVPALSRALTGARRALGGPQDPGILEVTGARPPRTCFNGPISAHRSFAFGSVSLDTVKAIKNAAGVKVNDVVVSVCAGAVREFLLERDELPEDPLVAMVPVSVRAEDEQGTFGNRISTMIVPIPTDVADPARRLERAHELLRSAKEHHAALPADLLTDASAFVPPAVAALAARTTVGILGRTRPPLNLVVSNVPGPRSPLFIAGARLEAHYPVSAVVDGVGLNMTVMSYLDHMDFGVVADRDQLPDVWPLLRGARREVEALATELGLVREADTGGRLTVGS